MPYEMKASRAGGRLRARRLLLAVGSLAAVAACVALMPAAASATESPFDFLIKGVTAVPGTNYNQIASGDPIDLNGKSIYILLDEGPACEARSLPNGQVYTPSPPLVACQANWKVRHRVAKSSFTPQATPSVAGATHPSCESNITRLALCKR